MTLWFHPVCAAYKRPEPLLETLSDTSAESVPDRKQLEDVARRTLSHRRLPRIDGAEPSPSGQARCRHCRKPIDRGGWRIRLVFYEEGMFTPGGFVHLGCSPDYFETANILEQVLHFSAALEPGQIDELKASFGSGR
jgi:hypothetical protein